MLVLGWNVEHVQQLTSVLNIIHMVCTAECQSSGLTSSSVCSDYEALLQQLQSSETSSGDSFYVRVNMSLPAGPGGTLAVSCNDILHVTNTRPAGTEDSWHTSHVHPCQQLDLQSGTVPNYYRLVHWWMKSSGSQKATVRSSDYSRMESDHYSLISWCHRAQRLLIRAIEDMSFEAKKSEKVRIN